MSTWRKILFASIIIALIVLTIVFWGTMAGACFLIILIQSFQVFLFNRYASSDLSETFQEDGQNVKGWRN